MVKKIPFSPAKIKVSPKGLNKLNTEYYLLTTNRSLPAYHIGPRNLCNLRLINDLRLRKITYEKIKLFLQNEPKFRKSQVDVTALLTREYVQMDTWSIRKNEPKQSQNEPNTNPIRTQFKPKQTQFHNPVCLQSPIFPAKLLITYINRICCVCSSSVSLDSAKMALYEGNWNLKKYGRKKLNLLEYKRLNKLNSSRPLTGTLFAYYYAGIFVLNN